jgi:long-chain fatty acid transport protein
MRKLLTFVAALFITGSLFAGGLVTNTNQSAAWVRLPSRNASTSIDAAYYNPAGLMKLENGFHVSLSNQYITQTREIRNSYSGPNGSYGLNDHVYNGTAKAPLFPSIFAVYKMDRFAFSLGFGVVGGGGAATYKTGLPSFGMSPSDLVPSLATKAGVSAYKLDAYFEGTSAFFGYQGNVAYKVNNWLSIAVGLRYVTAKNTYKGHLNDIQLNVGGTWLPASSVLAGLASNLTSIMGIPTKLAAAPGGATLAQLVSANQMTQADKDNIEKGLTAIGAPLGMNITSIKGAIALATPALKDQYISARSSSNLVSNQSADVSQTGSGFAPILSINLSPTENLNIAIKYEMATKLELKNVTKQDLKIGYINMAGSVPLAMVSDTNQVITMFPNGAITRNDMPAMLSIGIDYKILSNLKLSLGGNYYFDKSADYGHKWDDDMSSATPSVHIANKDIIASNGLSFQAGLEYKLSQKILVSGGFIWSNKGVNEKYQSDMTFGQASQTYGIGGAYNITDKIQLNLGFSVTQYSDASKTVDHMFAGTNIPSNEVYKKNTIMGGLGLDIRF